MLDASPELVKALQQVTTIAQAVILIPQEGAATDRACGPKFCYAQDLGL